MPLIVANNLRSLVKLSPTKIYDKFFHTDTTSLFGTLYEKHPPLRFFGSSHIGKMPLRIKNSIQLLIICSGKVSHTAMVASTLFRVMTSL